MDITAVARRAGVSTATVSRVLNDSTKVRPATAARVRDVIKELQYVPNTSARHLRVGRTNLYGLLVSDIRNPFFPDLIEQFESLAVQHGIDVTIANTWYSEDRLLAGVRRLLERNVDGIAVLTSEVSEAAVQKIREFGTPAVFLNQPTLSSDFRNITIDYVRGFRDAVEHLRMLGHQKVGFVAGPPSLSSAVRRRKAFQAAMKMSGLSVDEKWMFEGDHKITGGQFAAERIFSMTARPTAIICSNDLTAVGLLQTAARQGRVLPKELSVIGFDGLFFCEIVHPTLTSLQLSREDIASRAFFALQAIREETRPPQASHLLPSLVIRASTGPIGNDSQ